MATREERTFEHNGLEIDVIVTAGHNEELFYPGGKPVPQGRQEIVAGIQEIRYNSQRGGEREPKLKVFNHDIGFLEQENADIKAENEKLKRENNVLRQRIETFGVPMGKENNAKD